MGNPYAPKPPGAPVHRPVEPGPGSQPPALGDEPRPPAASPPPPLAPAPPAPPVDPDEARAATRSVLHFGLLMLATLVITSLAIPWRMLGLLAAAAALVVGVRALRRIWRTGLRGALVVALSAGMAMTVVLALATLAIIPVWQIEMDRQSCLDRAITISAQTGCEVDYKNAIKDIQNSSAP